EPHLRRILRAYARYYNTIRTHWSLDKDAPVSRPVQRTGIIRSRSVLGGLHHQYVRVWVFGTHKRRKPLRCHWTTVVGLTCVYRKLDSAIFVVKATENWVGRDGTEALNRAMERRVLVQGTMCPRLIIVDGICAYDS